jgi:hypothetical protein
MAHPIQLRAEEDQTDHRHATVELHSRPLQYLRGGRLGCDDFGRFPITAAQLIATQSDDKRAQDI